MNFHTLENVRTFNIALIASGGIPLFGSFGNKGNFCTFIKRMWAGCPAGTNARSGWSQSKL